MISYLCNISGVSRSGYYRYFSSATIEKRKSNEIKDLSFLKEDISGMKKFLTLINEKNRIKEINKKILLEEDQLNNLDNKLKEEKEKQGMIRTLFYDNELVNDLEEQINIHKDNLNILIKELKKEEEKL